MSNSHRIAWIDGQVRAGRYPSAESIAAHFEISTRQAQRDIEYLRHSMGAPIIWVRERGGYAYGDDTFVLPALVVTDDDVRVFHWLAHRYGASSEPDAARLGDLFTKLVDSAAVVPPPNTLPASLNDRADDVALDEHAVHIYDALRRATAEHRKLRLHYRNSLGRLLSPVVRPYALALRHGATIVLIYDETNGDAGLIALGDIERVEHLSELFNPLARPPTVPDSELPPLEPHHAVVRMEPVALRHDTAPLPDGTLRIAFADSRRLLYDLLGCGVNFEILRPQWLRERAQRHLSELATRHQ